MQEEMNVRENADSAFLIFLPIPGLNIKFAHFIMFFSLFSNHSCLI